MPNTENADTDVLTSREVRDMLGIVPMKLSRMIAKGEIRPLPYSGALEHPHPYQFARAEVERVLRLIEERARQRHIDYDHRIPAAS